MKPVFGNKKREDRQEDRHIEDITTVSSVGDVGKENSNMMTSEQAEEMANRVATKAVETALAKRKERDDDDVGPSISNKTVNELKNIAEIFNALKSFSSNPLQKKIEEKVGDMAASVVEKSFGVQPQEQKKDLIDQILNSSFAAGIGAGLGQKGPEMVQALTTSFGREKVDGWISGAMNKGGGGGPRGLGGIPGGQTQPQSEMEMVLGLDVHNPEHVSAYAASQGGMSIETARKVLQIHQDDFIRQMQLKGGGGVGGGAGSGVGGGVGNAQGNNVQGYRPREVGPPPRVNDDLIANIPVTEDKRWEIPNDDIGIAGTGNLETQNVKLHPEMERVKAVEQERIEPTDNLGSGNNSEQSIMDYLKQLNDYVAGIKDVVESQNNQISKLQEDLEVIKGGNNSELSRLQEELEVIKRDRITPETPEDTKEETPKEEETDWDGNKVEKDIKVDKQTTIRSLKSIKKGKMEE